MKKLISSLTLLFLFVSLSSQEIKHAFWNDIQAFKKQDSISIPAKGQILFVGSSSFTKWTDVQNYFPGYKILNRGFGGSTLEDVIYYADDVIFKYDPKQIIIYCGENDLAYNMKLTAEQVAQRFFTLFKMIRKKYKKIPVAYVTMKPSPSRINLMPKYEAANKMIKEYLAKKKKASFIDVYHKMLKADGTPLTDIFISDNLHMNAKGYAIWQKEIEPYLLKD